MRCVRGDRRDAHAALSPSIRPERRRTTRSQRAPSAASCVTSTSVVPRSSMAGEQQIDDLLAGALVEIAGRLVGDQDRRIGRQRARQRDALLLAAGQLRRIMMQRARRVRPRPARARARSSASATPASSSGTATFSSAVMVGMRWKDWKTMPTLRPRKRASASSSSVPRSRPRRRRVPVSGRSSPAITISRVDLPEPDGPTRPIASPRPILQVDILEDMNPGRAAAEREIDAGRARWPGCWERCLS